MRYTLLLILLFVSMLGLVIMSSYYINKDFEDRGCIYTGKTEKERYYSYNSALKMNTPKTRTSREYTCEIGEGGWR